MCTKAIHNQLVDFYQDEFLVDKIILYDAYDFQNRIAEISKQDHFVICGMILEISVEFALCFNYSYPFLPPKILILSNFESEYIFDGVFCANLQNEWSPAMKIRVLLHILYSTLVYEKGKKKSIKN